MQFVGTRNKSDMLMYLAHVLTKINKRVLIIDSTQNQWYRNGYTRMSKGQHVYDFQGIDILSDVTNWLDIEESLKKTGETHVNYDVILVDIDSAEILEQEWPEFHERFYVGDFDRAHQLRDVNLIDTLIHTTLNTAIKRITLASKYKLNAEYFDTILSARLGKDIQWRSMNYIFEPDEIGEELRNYMQHEQDIPYKRLNKQYKDLLCEMISALYGLHINDVKDAMKPNFFRRSSNPKKAKTLKIFESTESAKA